MRTTSWRTRGGQRRFIRLYSCYRNMLARTRGGGSKYSGARSCWKGLTVEFLDWPHFRAWAIKSGYRKGVELDRISNLEGYGPHNCQWLEKLPHLAKTVAGHKSECRCTFCGWRPIVKRDSCSEAPF